MATNPNDVGAVQASPEQIADMVKQAQGSEGHKAGEINMDILDATDPFNQEAVAKALAEPPKIEKQEDELAVEGIEDAEPPKGKKQQPQRRDLQEIKNLREERRELNKKLEDMQTEYRQFQNYMLGQLSQQGQLQQQPMPENQPPNYEKFFDPNSIVGEDGQIDPNRFAANYREYNQAFIGDLMNALDGRLQPLEAAIDQTQAQTAMQQFGQTVGFKQGTARKELSDILFAAINANKNFPKQQIGQVNDIIAHKLKAAFDEDFQDKLETARKKKEEAARRKQTTPALSGGGMGGSNAFKDGRPDADTIDEADTRMREFLKRLKAGG